MRQQLSSYWQFYLARWHIICPNSLILASLVWQNISLGKTGSIQECRQFYACWEMTHLFSDAVQRRTTQIMTMCTLGLWNSCSSCRSYRQEDWLAFVYFDMFVDETAALREAFARSVDKAVATHIQLHYPIELVLPPSHTSSILKFCKSAISVQYYFKTKKKPSNFFSDWLKISSYTTNTGCHWILWPLPALAGICKREVE